jgi:hypothetical protein
MHHSHSARLLLSLLMIASVEGLTALPTFAQKVDLIKNPKWRQIPRITSSLESQDQYSAEIDMNGMAINGYIRTFDLITTNAAYSRSQVNCQTKQFRTLRYGEFKSTKTSISIKYTDVVAPFESNLNEVQQKILTFVCQN